MTKTIEGKKKYIQHSVQNFKKTKKEKKKKHPRNKFSQKLGPLKMPPMFNIMD